MRSACASDFHGLPRTSLEYPQGHETLDALRERHRDPRACGAEPEAYRQHERERHAQTPHGDDANPHRTHGVARALHRAHHDHRVTKEQFGPAKRANERGSLSAAVAPKHFASRALEPT